MAAGTLPKPGKITNGREVGPCEKPCNHIDCAQTRLMADTLCCVCKKPIGYENLFYAKGIATRKVTGVFNKERSK